MAPVNKDKVLGIKVMMSEARLALDKAAQPGERQAAAAKLIESFYVRG